MDNNLEQALVAGKLLSPREDGPSFVHLVRALAALGGVKSAPRGEQAAALAAQIGPAEHLVFVLVDGMGMALLENLLPPEAFLRRHQKGELRAVFPSTTACAMATLATGQWPAQHGIPGWWAYLQEYRLSVTPLLFAERYSGTPLQQHGVPAHALWPLAPLMGTMERAVLAVGSQKFWHSVFSRYLRGWRPGLSYGEEGVAGALTVAAQHIGAAKEPSFTYLYFPELDSVSHEYGPQSAEARRELAAFDRQLGRFADQLQGRARLVISADHGHMATGKENHLTLYCDDPLLDLLQVPPNGEPRVPTFHVRPGRQRQFADQFRRRFGERMALLSLRNEAVGAGLLGPQRPNARARRRFGDFIGVALEPVTLKYYPPKTSPEDDHIGHHAGLTPEEMRLPLILS